MTTTAGFCVMHSALARPATNDSARSWTRQGSENDHYGGLLRDALSAGASSYE